MYLDEDFITCPECGDLGKFAPNLWGTQVFFHKRPSQLDGYFTFSQLHKITNENLRKAN